MNDSHQSAALQVVATTRRRRGCQEAQGRISNPLLPNKKNPWSGTPRLQWESILLGRFLFRGGHASLKASLFEANLLHDEPRQRQTSSKTRLLEAGLFEDRPPRGQASSKTSLLEAVSLKMRQYCPSQYNALLGSVRSFTKPRE